MQLQWTSSFCLLTYYVCTWTWRLELCTAHITHSSDHIFPQTARCPPSSCPHTHTSTSISRTRQQAVEANRCNARTASLETSYDHRTPSICTCLSPCLACNRPPRQTAVESKKSNARAYQCLWQRTATPWYHDTIIPQWCLSPCHACNRPPRQTAVESKKKQCKSLPMSLTKNSHSMIPWYNHTTVLSQISPVSTPRESSLRHDERAPQTVENKQWFTTLTNDDHVLYISCMSEQL